jgi:hypothetical protein
MAPELERVERQLADYKANEARNHPGYAPGPGTWPVHYSEDTRLRVLEQELDWTGVDHKQKEAVLAREVDFTRIGRDALNGVYDSVFADTGREVDERPGRRLFDNANFANALADQSPFAEQLAAARPATQNLVQSVLLDEWPRPSAVVDFGLDSQKHYEALYYPIRNQEISPAVLDAAMGHGERLTGLAAGSPSNPHKDVQFYTSWDVLLGREPQDAFDPGKYAHHQPARGKEREP